MTDGRMQATASDDCTWRMWQLPDAELIMAGEGHKDWVAGLEFHPGGACLATGSGDSTVKLWDFAEQRCAATLSEHTGAVWAVAFHDAGEVLASCSLDQTIRLWDVAAAAVKTVRVAAPWCCPEAHELLRRVCIVHSMLRCRRLRVSGASIAAL